MKILLHVCCAVCAAYCLEKLRQEGHEVTGFFYNPNIHPEQEYLKRLEETERLGREQRFPLIVGDYNLEAWSRRIKGWEQEPEGGRRCPECFGLRLEATAKLAEEKRFEAFATTLTVSPHKNAKVINKIGSDIANGLFLTRDFKKQDGFKKTQELAKQYNLYRQDYCGCIYSLKERRKDGRIHKKARPLGHKDETS